MNLLELMVKVGIDDEASGKIGEIGNKVKSGLGSAAVAGAKAMGAAVAAAGAGAVALGKQSLDAYASYEQLSGGISKLFGTAGQSIEEYAESAGKSLDQVRGEYANLSEAESLVMENAQNAFMTTGMSANDYMEQVSGFSAALVNSLGGDTVEAANRADVAMRAISDNVNTFGSDAESVSNAFQGFAKQNYTMLDNLKLGYGGTKEEMQRLIDDANEWGAANGQASDLSIESFADIVTAIDQVQQKQNIAGTTAREAATTIEGSVNMTKAAWSNLLAELGKDDGDVGARMKELGESAMTALTGAVDEQGNVLSTGILGRVRSIMESVAEYLPQVTPMVTEALNAVIPVVVEIVSTAAPALLEAVASVVTSLADALPGLLVAIIPAVVALMPRLMTAGVTLFTGLVTALAKVAPQVVAGIKSALAANLQTIRENGPQMMEAAGELFRSMVTAIRESGPEILQTLGSMLGEMVLQVVAHVPDMLAAAGELMTALVDAVAESIEPAIEALGAGVESMLGAVAAKAGDMAAAAWNFVKSVPERIGQGVSQAKAKAGEMVSAVVGKVKELPDKVRSAVSGASSWLVNAGRDIIQGLINGITEKIGAVRSKLSELTSMIPSWKGPRDVDRKLLYENGQVIMGGLVRGIESYMPRLESTLGRVTDSIGGFSPTFQTAATAGASPSAGVTVNFTYNGGDGFGEALDELTSRMTQLRNAGVF